MKKLLDAVRTPEFECGTDLMEMMWAVKEEAEQIHQGLTIKITHIEENMEFDIKGSHLLPIVFVNLFRNSAEYSEGKVSVEITISRVEKGAQIDIVDDGPGIPDDIRSKLFQKGVFTSGNGYGLYLSRKVIEGYNGSINLSDNDSRRGFAFRIILPVHITVG